MDTDAETPDVIERIVDHVVIAVDERELAPLSERLQGAGLELADEVVEDHLGINSHLLILEGGGFVEISAPINGARSAMVPDLFEGTPRVSAISYTTNDLAADLDSFRSGLGGENAFAAAGSWVRKSGTSGFYVAGSPVKLGSGISFQAQERRVFPLPYLDHPRVAQAPAVRRVTVTGPDAGLWEQRHRAWYKLPAHDGVMHAGSTDLVFDDRADGSTVLSVTFKVPSAAEPIELSHGAVLDFITE